MAVLNFASEHGSTLVWISIALCVLYIPVSCYLNYRRCSHIRGPWLAQFSSLWLFNTTFKGRLYLDVAETLDKYGIYLQPSGSLARISPNKIVTNDPDLWRSMSAPRSTFTRGTWYDSMTLNPRVKNSMSQRDEKEHNKLRAKMIRGYSGKDIPSLESRVDRSVVELIHNLQRQAATDQPVDMSRLAQFFTLDVLTDIAFGAPFGFVTKNEDVFRYVQEVSSFLAFLELTSNFPTIYSMITSPLMAPFAPKPTDKTGMGAMLGVAQQVVHERYAPDAKQYDDMLGSFIRNGLTSTEAQNESVLQILGGSDSTATVVRMTFMYIMTNPNVYMKIKAELDAAKAKGVVSHPIISCAESNTHLPYLHACIKESLRMFPPLVGLQTKLPPPEGATWNGIHIPVGIEVCWSPRSMQRRPDIYGADIDTYRPERWIEAEAESEAAQSSNPGPNNTEPHPLTTSKIMRMNQTLDLVFGSGKYGCLGKTVAWMELDKVFVALFDNFDFALCNPLVPMKTISHGVHVQTDLMVKVYPKTRLESEK